MKLWFVDPVDWASLSGILGALAAGGALLWTVSTSRTKLRKAERLVELAQALGVNTLEGRLIDVMARRAAQEVYVRSVITVDFFTVYIATGLTLGGVGLAVVLVTQGVLDPNAFWPSLLLLALVFPGPLILYVHLVRVRWKRKTLVASTDPAARYLPRDARTGGHDRPAGEGERR